uniref:Secreted protein n=1 Tax=Romanomermis culicivorax TaxID=13658 RepID=A0A915KI28_ROMCU
MFNASTKLFLTISGAIFHVTICPKAITIVPLDAGSSTIFRISASSISTVVFRCLQEPTKGVMSRALGRS